MPYFGICFCHYQIKNSIFAIDTVMKNKTKLLLIPFLAIGFLTACQPEEEPTPADARDPFVDQWTCAENSSQIGATSYTVHINKSTSSNTQIQLENFYNIGFTFKANATVSGTSVTIPTQQYNGNDLHGSGSKTGPNTITLTYYMDNGSTIDTCTATLTRQ
jgi:hypothetical protein